MEKLIGIAVPAMIGATAVAIGTSTPVTSALWMIPTATLATVALLTAGAEIARSRFRPLVDAAEMMRGVCPSCRTFNSLEEVTSASPNSRSVKCHACGERYDVNQDGNRLVAERLGKPGEEE